MEQLFHGCDIGNPCADYENYISWAALLGHEFNEQAKLEKSKGLEVATFLIYKDLNSLFADQGWFVGSMVLPLWKEIHQICPGVLPMLKNVESNILRVKEEQALFKSSASSP